MLLAVKTWVRHPANGSAETFAMFQGSDVGLLRVWILSVRGANCSNEDRSVFFVFFRGVQVQDRCVCLGSPALLRAQGFLCCWRGEMQTLEKVQIAVQEITFLLRRC